MAKLTIYVDNGIRSTVARQQLKNLSIDFDEVNVGANVQAAEFLVTSNLPVSKFPLPQYYVGETLAWENGYKDIAELSAGEINQRVEDINASS
jgi:hypothetical protein